MHKGGLWVLLALVLLAGIGETAAVATPESIAAANNVYVSNMSFDPGAFFTGDTGTVTVTVTNGNANQAIGVNHATFGDRQFQLTSGTYDTSSDIGPHQSRTYQFSIVSDAPTGSYFPTFSLDLRDADNLYHRGMVWVDNTPLTVTVLSKPDSFTRAKKDTISLQIANPRKNEVKNVVVDIAGGDGVEIMPASRYVGSLASGASVLENFSVTPGRESVLNATVSYDNGDNHHHADLQVPVLFSPDKKKANPVVSNIAVTSVAGIIHVTGDITNAGLTTANAVSVTSLGPAIPQDPYKTYVIGTLKPDDFGSFEVTFSADRSTTVPLQLSYKDADGNVQTSTEYVTIPQYSSVAKKTGFPVLPVAAVIIVLVLFVGGWVLYLRKYNQ